MPQPISQSNASLHSPVSQGRFPVRMPIRMTEAERAIIGKSACALNRSISRYLVELATAKEANTPARLQPEDRARVQFLQALFQGAGEKIKGVLNSERFARGDDEGIRAAILCLEEVLRLLEAIGVELGRRTP